MRLLKNGYFPLIFAFYKKSRKYVRSIQFPYGSPHHIPTNAYISAFVGFCFLRKLPLSIVCPLFLNVLCISPKFWLRRVFFKPFFHHFYLCLYGNPVLRIQRYLPLPVPVGTCGCRCLIKVLDNNSTNQVIRLIPA